MFRETHILAFFKLWQDSGYPLDRALSTYFKTHRSLGAHDRREIGEIVYTLVRWECLFDELDPSDSASKRLHLLKRKPIEEWIQDPNLSSWAQCGMPKFLYQKIASPEICRALQTSAPISIRVNLLKTDRTHLFQKLSPRFSVSMSPLVSTAIRFAKREPLFATPEFRAGLFEVQDEGSQMIANLVQAKSGDRVLDYCAGSGGKSLAIAPKMKGKGELYLHDIRPKALAEAKLRMRRAGVQNGQILSANHPTLKKLTHKMDWVLIDVPCSGSGTLRRNPEMKKKIDAPLIERLCLEQRAILKEAVSYLKPGGSLVYATCSIFEEENQAQIEWALQHLSLKLEGAPLAILPSAGGPDGFFGAVLTTR